MVRAEASGAAVAGAAAWLADAAAAADAAFRAAARGGAALDAAGAVTAVQRDFAASVLEVGRGADAPELRADDAAKPGARLVRVRGMVQDEASSSMYGQVRVQGDGDAARTTLLRPAADDAGAGEWREMGMVRVLSFYVVPVPGEDGAEGPGVDAAEADGRRGAKRSADGGAPAPPRRPVAREAAVDAARNCVAAAGGAARGGAAVVHLVVADDDDEPALSREPALNQIVDVWGVVAPGAADGGDETMEDDDGGLDGVPFRHVAAAHRVDAVAWRPAAAAPPAPPLPAAERGAACDAALRWATAALGGDAVAAELLLVQAAARVLRHDPVVLGTVPVNLTHCTPHGAAAAAGVLSALHARMVAYPVTRDTLCDGGWVPKKDHDTDSLRTGRLQLAAGTLLVLDESAMTPGTLSADGVKAIHALQGMCTMQQVQYDFDFSHVDIRTSTPVVVLSSGGSLVKVPLRCPLQPTSPVPSAAESAAAAGAVGSVWRDLFTHTREADPLPLADGLEQMVTADCAEAKLAHGAEWCESPVIVECTTHQWVTLARGIAALDGAAEVAAPHWRRAAELGAAVLARRRAAPKPPAPQVP